MEENKNLKELELEAVENLNKVQNEQDLNEVKAAYLGKKSKLQSIMATMKDLTNEARRELGQKVNEFKTKIEELANQKREELVNRAVNEKLKKEATESEKKAVTLTMEIEKDVEHSKGMFFKEQAEKLERESGQNWVFSSPSISIILTGRPFIIVSFSYGVL